MYKTKISNMRNCWRSKMSNFVNSFHVTVWSRDGLIAFTNRDSYLPYSTDIYLLFWRTFFHRIRWIVRHCRHQHQEVILKDPCCLSCSPGSASAVLEIRHCQLDVFIILKMQCASYHKQFNQWTRLYKPQLSKTSTSLKEWISFWLNCIWKRQGKQQRS